MKKKFFGHKTELEKKPRANKKKKNRLIFINKEEKPNWTVLEKRKTNKEG